MGKSKAVKKGRLSLDLCDGRDAAKGPTSCALRLKTDDGGGPTRLPVDEPMHTGGGEYCSPELRADTTSQPTGAARLWEARQRDGDEEMQPAKRPREESVRDDELYSLPIDVPLCPTQRETLNRVISSLDPKSSVVITNPQLPDNPIVYVTMPWERMCGFSYAEAMGRNPRLTQGEQSDKSAMRQIAGALTQQRACKVMMLNYRSGRDDRPFWNMLSISPVLHRGKLEFYIANLQDYTYHISKLVSRSPSQFCRSAEIHQCTRRLPSRKASLRLLAQPTPIETDDEFDVHLSPTAAAAAAALEGGSLSMKRLGWSQLSLDPEHLTERVLDCLETMGARYELVGGTADVDDVFVVNAELDGVAARVIVTRDPANEGSYRISCSRLGGDTFAYHEIFREMRRLLGDALDGAVSLMGARPGAVSDIAKRGGAIGGLRLAPLPPPPPLVSG